MIFRDRKERLPEFKARDVRDSIVGGYGGVRHLDLLWRQRLQDIVAWGEPITAAGLQERAEFFACPSLARTAQMSLPVDDLSVPLSQITSLAQKGRSLLSRRLAAQRMMWSGPEACCSSEISSVPFFYSPIGVI
jgi:hypothetical protein